MADCKIYPGLSTCTQNCGFSIIQNIQYTSTCTFEKLTVSSKQHSRHIIGFLIEAPSWLYNNQVNHWVNCIISATPSNTDLHVQAHDQYRKKTIIIPIIFIFVVFLPPSSRFFSLSNISTMSRISSTS